MPWSVDRYPVAMKNLPPRVRLKAVEIANALLDEGYDEGRCIRIAIARAKRWARTHGGPWSGTPITTANGRRP